MSEKNENTLSDLISKTDLKVFIALTAWVLVLVIIGLVTFGLLMPSPNSLQEMLVNKAVELFSFVFGLAIGAWLFGKAPEGQTVPE